MQGVLLDTVLREGLPSQDVLQGSSNLKAEERVHRRGRDKATANATATPLPGAFAPCHQSLADRLPADKRAATSFWWTRGHKKVF